MGDTYSDFLVCSYKCLTGQITSPNPGCSHYNVTVLLNDNSRHSTFTIRSCSVSFSTETGYPVYSFPCCFLFVGCPAMSMSRYNRTRQISHSSGFNIHSYFPICYHVLQESIKHFFFFFFLENPNWKQNIYYSRCKIYKSCYNAKRASPIYELEEKFYGEIKPAHLLTL